MQLIIAQTRSTADLIVRALDIRWRQANGYYEGDNVIVTWITDEAGRFSMPHIQASEPEKPTWEILPVIPERYEVDLSAYSLQRFSIIKELIYRKDVTELINACDPGREGEYLFNIVHRICFKPKPVKRLWLKAQTEDAVRKAWSQMRSGTEYRQMLEALRAQAKADWVISSNAKYAYTLFRNEADSSIPADMSIGVYQTPVLKILYDRANAIRNFRSTGYWKLYADFAVFSGSYIGKWFDQKDGQLIDQLYDKAHVLELIKKLDGRQGKVVFMDTEVIKTPSKRLLDLTSLQVEASRRFGFSAQQTLDLALRLYREARCITYPCTDNRRITSGDLFYRLGVFKALAKMSEYANFINDIWDNDWGSKALSSRFVDSSGASNFTAIQPTDSAPVRLLSPDELKIYDLIVRRTLAMYYPDRVEHRTTVHTQVDQLHFETIQTICTDEGWLVIDPLQEEGEQEEHERVPLPKLLKVRDVVTADDLFFKKTKSNRPVHFTDGTLLGSIGQLGTPELRTSIIEGMVKQRLAERKGDKIYISRKGRALLDSIKIEKLVTPAIAAEWDSQLRQIEQGQSERAQFMQKAQGFATEIVRDFRRLARHEEVPPIANLSFVQEISAKCPRCRASLFVKKDPNNQLHIVCQNYNSQDDNECVFAFGCLSDGTSTEGHCRKNLCNGPLVNTANGDKKCLICETRQSRLFYNWKWRFVEGNCPLCASHLRQGSPINDGFAPALACRNSECSYFVLIE